MEKEAGKKCCSKKSCCICKIVLYAVVILAIAGAYCLHFCDKPTAPAVMAEGQAGNGNVLFINMDSISSQYALVKILTEDVDAELQKQQAIFANKEKAFQSKYAQFEQNYQAGILTQQQVQYTTEQLQKEYEALEMEKTTVLSNLEARQIAALEQVADSVRTVAKRLNEQRYGASYILTNTQLLFGDPTKDITNDIIEELNKSYKK